MKFELRGSRLAFARLCQDLMKHQPTVLVYKLVQEIEDQLEPNADGCFNFFDIDEALAIPSTPIDYSKLSVRAGRALKNFFNYTGVVHETIECLYEITDDQFLRTPGIGRKSLNEIRAMVAEVM